MDVQAPDVSTMSEEVGAVEEETRAPVDRVTRLWIRLLVAQAVIAALLWAGWAQYSAAMRMLGECQ